MSLQLPLKRVQCQAAVTRCWWQTVPHCEPVEGEAALARPHLHSWQLDTSSRCRPQSRTNYNFLHRHAELLQIGATPWMHFSYDDTRAAVLKMILRRSGSQDWNVVVPRRRALQSPDTNQPGGGSEWLFFQRYEPNYRKMSNLAMLKNLFSNS